MCKQLIQNDKYNNIDTSNFALDVDVEIEILELAINHDSFNTILHIRYIADVIFPSI